MLQRKTRTCFFFFFFRENLSRCHSGVPCAAAVVAVRHVKPAGRLVFATAIEFNSIMSKLGCKQR